MSLCVSVGQVAAFFLSFHVTVSICTISSPIKVPLLYISSALVVIVLLEELPHHFPFCLVVLPGEMTHSAHLTHRIGNADPL